MCNPQAEGYLIGPITLLYVPIKAGLDAFCQDIRPFHPGIHGQDYKLIPADAGHYIRLTKGLF
jgi:hypothetical protein